MNLSTEDAFRGIVADLQRDELFALRRLVTVSSTYDNAVHLLDLLSVPEAARRSLCRAARGEICPTSWLWHSACDKCLRLALAAGFTVARGSNAMVNLHRVPRAHGGASGSLEAG